MIFISKINKSLLLEEVEVSNELKRNLIHLFMDAESNLEDQSGEQKAISILLNGLNELNVRPELAIEYIGKSVVDPQMYVKFVQLHNKMVDSIKKSEFAKSVDAFPNFPKIGHDPHQVPTGNKAEYESTSIEKQLDSRKNKKNLKGGISEQNIEPSEKELLQYFKNSYLNKDKETKKFKLVDKEINNFYDGISYFTNKYAIFPSDLYDYLISLKDKLTEDNFNFLKIKLEDEMMKEDPPQDHYMDDDEFEKKSSDMYSKITGKPDLKLVSDQKIIKFGIGSILKR